MNGSPMYERDLLYPTENINEPGSIHVEVLNPNKKGKMPIVIESKTYHSPVKYIDSIVRIMQSDIFDRILLNIRNSMELYIVSNDDISSISGGKKYILAIFNGEKIEFKGVDEIEA
jgi:hypothetical protein